MYPEQFEDLIHVFRRLPGVGQKTAERYAYSVMDWDEETRKQFVKAIQEVDLLKPCPICGNMTADPVCSICSDESRDKDIICVVQSPKNIATLESIEMFHGAYHVLNGLINPKKGVLPVHLNIENLEKRIQDSTKEVILALDPNIEGETTALYLEKLLDGKVKVTRLATGVPVGGQLDYADLRTLQMAFEGRR